MQVILSQIEKQKSSDVTISMDLHPSYCLLHGDTVLPFPWLRVGWRGHSFIWNSCATFHNRKAQCRQHGLRYGMLLPCTVCWEMVVVIVLQCSTLYRYGGSWAFFPHLEIRRLVSFSLFILWFSFLTLSNYRTLAKSNTFLWIVLMGEDQWVGAWLHPIAPGLWSSLAATVSTTSLSTTASSCISLVTSIEESL